MHGQLHAGERALGVLHTPGEHPLCVLEHPRCVRGIRGDVADLCGIRVEIEEDRRQRRVTRELHELAVVVAQHGERALLERESEGIFDKRAVGIAKVELEMGFVAPVADIMTAQPGRERAAVTLQRHVEVEQLAERRQEVDVFGIGVDGARPVDARTTHDERDVVRLVEPAELVEHEVVAEVLAVVAREDHERAAGLAGVIEPIQDPRDLVVDLGDHPVVGRLQLALFPVVVRRFEERMVDHHREQRMLLAFGCARVGPHRRRHRRGVVHRVVGRGREERGMRPQVGDVREPAAAGRGPGRRPLDEPVGQERRLRVFGLVLRAPSGTRRGLIDESAPLLGNVHAVGPHPGEPRVGLALREMAHRVETRQHALVLVEPRVVGRAGARVDARVGVAEQRGLVAGAAAGERDVVVARVERGPVQH